MSQLTVAQRALLHLSLFARFREEFECPLAVTQKGIAQALGVSRSHVALELKKLIEEGRLETHLAHVRGARSRRKVYFPTREGERVALALRSRANGARARWIDPDGRVREGRGRDLFRRCGDAGVPLTKAYLAVLRGETVDLRGRPRPPQDRAPDDFVGRTEELDRLRRWRDRGPRWMVITGIPGIGKTALARAFAAGDAVWVKVFPFDGPASLLASLGGALARAGRPRLQAHLKGHPLDYAEVGLVLSREAADLLLVFDDASAAPEAVRVLELLEEAEPPGTRVLLTAREVPAFLRSPARPTERMAELRLEGLPRADALALARRLAPEGRPGDLVRRTRGHPLFLRLAASSTAPFRPRDLEDRLMEEILAGLQGEEERGLLRAAPFRRPFPPRALGDLRTGVARSLLRKGLLVESDGGYELHDLVAPLVRRHAGDALAEAHRRAARFWTREEEWVEALHHLLEAGGLRRATRLVHGRYEAILEAGRGADLLEVLERLPLGPDLDVPLARTLNRLGRWDEAQAAVDRGLERAGPQARVALLLLRGRLRSKRGDLEGAARAFEAARGLAESLGQVQRVGEALYGTGIVWRKRGEPARAAEALAAALTRFQEAGAPREAGRARMEMGVLRLQAGEVEAAVEAFTAARPLLEGSRRDAAPLHTNLGIAHRKLGDLEAARAAFEAGVRLAAEGGLIREEAHARANAADLLVHLGDLERAEAWCLRALEAFRRLRDPVMIAACVANLAKVEGARRRFDRAQALYRESLEALGTVPAPYTRAGILEEMGELYETMGDAGRAAAVAQEAQAVLRTLQREGIDGG